ncbi:MAG: 16S rRNA (cytidine(1402)-2'-O)-methyltransferase [Gammaproteobacteria bacterium]|nr:MAG: 16S rRNA (cytidine(1402)-2'-O)-methyltransferase [Gammaproteobacteria bacterium]
MGRCRQPKQVEAKVSIHKGTLYVVATPIGNLEDISKRAVVTLARADLIVAEDTRHSGKLLQRLGLNVPMQSLHDFNEREKSEAIIQKLLAGKQVALISDAGTPLICDPGFRLVQRAIAESISVTSIPGPCALIAALSVAGLPTDRFLFNGFAPERGSARRELLESLTQFTSTMVFYETPHRIADFLADAVAVFGGGRQACVAREITKLFESIYRDSLGNLHQLLTSHTEFQRGEFAVLIQGAVVAEERSRAEHSRLLKILLGNSLSVKQAAVIASEISGSGRRELYQLALEMTQNRRSGDEQ